MRLVIDLSHYETLYFNITGLTCHFDEEGAPIDIAIWGDENTLEAIAKYADFGYNIRELSCANPDDIMDIACKLKGATHVAIYARLNVCDFNVFDSHKGYMIFKP